MSSTTDREATIRWSPFTLSTPTTQLADDVSTSSLVLLESGSDHQPNQLGVKTKPSISSDDTRKMARKVVPLSSGEDRPSTGAHTSNRRSLETIGGKSSRTVEPTEPRISHTKPSTSRKKLKEKIEPPSSSCTLVAAKQPNEHVDSGVRDASDVTICGINVDELTTTPITVPSVSPAESSCKSAVELRSTINTKSKHKSTKAKRELKDSGAVTKAKLSPLQDLSLNTGLSLPLSVPPPLPSTPPDISDIYTGGTTEDKFGCVKLGAPELTMAITFYQTPHFEIWDAPDEAHVHWPAQVNLTVKNAAKWSHKPLALPDIRMLDIQCSTKSKPSIYSEYDTEASHTVHYLGAKLQDSRGKPLPLLHENGITIEPEWVRSYGKIIGKGGNPRERGIGIGERGWYLKIWVPIPMLLFRKRETRTFLLRAGVWIGDDEGDIVEATAEMTVSHLRREREMI